VEIAVKGEVYPARNVLHRNMGPLDSCEKCHGRGWYPQEIPNPAGPSFSGHPTIPDYYDSEEVYCDCPCGEARKKIE
jgi:hypothetical protein